MSKLNIDDKKYVEYGPNAKIQNIGFLIFLIGIFLVICIILFSLLLKIWTIPINDLILDPLNYILLFIPT
ncbi:MAG: hypothetical protein ACXAC7_07100, partial [Candidatus Hodarchaeales archaeon]